MIIRLLARLGAWIRQVVNDLGFSARFMTQLLLSSLRALRRPGPPSAPWAWRRR